MSGFNNYEGMVEELKKVVYSDPRIEQAVAALQIPRDIDEIVILYNLYCMPSKHESQNSYNKPRSQKGRRRN